MKKKYFSKIPHNPPESYGDCVRACISTLIQSDNVPHFFDGRPTGDSWKALRSFLNKQSLDLAIFVVDDPWDDMAQNNPDIPYMLLCSTATGDHAVVCLNGKVFHDPSGLEILGEHSLGFWFVGVIVKCQ